MSKITYVFVLLFITLSLTSQTKQELRVFSFDNLTKKALQCDHYYCCTDNKIFKIHPTSKSSWFFEKEKGSRFLIDHKKFSHIKIVKTGYMPELYSVDQISKVNDTANIFLKELRKEFDYIFKNIIFNEDLSINLNASKYHLDLYRNYFLAKTPRLKIVIVNVSSKYIDSEEKKAKAAFNLKKLLGFEERLDIKIDNSLPEGNSNEVMFKITAL